MAVTDGSILLRIRGDSSQAIQEFDHFRKEFKKTEKAIKDLDEGILGNAFLELSRHMGLTGAETAQLQFEFKELAKIGSVAAAGLAAGFAVISAAAIGTVVAVFKLSQAASEYGSTIHDAAQKTGANTDSLQALKHAAEQSGSSFEGVADAVAKFNVLIGNAAAGNEKAEAILKRYGITSRETDKALIEAISTISKMTSSTAQAAAAGALFKDHTGEILPVIKSFKGDLPGLIEELRNLGLIMSKDGIETADELGDQMDLLNKQFSAVGRTIGEAFMPIFLDMARSLSEFFARNQGEIQQWGQNAANIVRGFMVTLEDFNRVTTNVTNSSAAAWLGWANKILIILNPVALALQTILRYMGAVGAANSQLSIGDLRQADDTRSFTPAISSGIPRSVGGGRARAGGGRSEADRAAELAARLAERDLVAQIRLETENLKTIQEQGVKTYEEIRKKLGEGASIVSFLKETNDQTANWQDNLKRSLAALEALENQAQKADATEHERALLRQKQEERRQKLVDDGLKENERNEKALHDARTKRWEERLEQGRVEADLSQRYFNEEMDREEERARVLGLNRGEGIAGITLPDIDLTELLPEESVFDLWTESWNLFADAIEQRSGDVATSLETLGDIFQDAFGGMANALASAVEQWVLYGETGPAVLRKVLASALASIAAEAAVQAIYATALGFIRLAQWDFAAAANAFTSAAIFASVAGVAALAGRAIAGDAFKKQATAATGGSTSSGSRSTDAQGGAFSSFGDKPYIQEEGRSSPLGVQVELSFKDKPAWFTQMFIAEWRANGRIRRLVEDGR